MFFLLFVAVMFLAMIGFGSVLGAGLSGLSVLFLVPLLILKIMFIMMLFGFIGRRLSRRRPPWGWDRPGGQRPGRPHAKKPSTSSEDAFEEWHRMAHAREEVDGWVSGGDDTARE